MPPKRRRRFQGLYYHSSPPKVLPMNTQIANSNGRQRRDHDDLSVKLSTIRIWMHEKDIGKLTRVLWAGQGNRLRQQASTNGKVKRFLAAVPHVMNSIKDVHQAVIDNSLENLQANLEPPVPPTLVTCRDANGLNLIHKAAGLGHATILEYLITTWPDGVNETDITGKTPLHWAASAKNNMRCYTLLREAGCDEEALDYKMKTPSFYRHKPHEIERAFLMYVPEAPRVSPDVATDWDALSDDRGNGKKLDIKIPEMNGFGGHSNAESHDNTSETETLEGVSNRKDVDDDVTHEDQDENSIAKEDEENNDNDVTEEESDKKDGQESEQQVEKEAPQENDEEEKEEKQKETEETEEPQDEKQQTQNHSETTANLIEDLDDGDKTEKEIKENNELESKNNDEENFNQVDEHKKDIESAEAMPVEKENDEHNLESSRVETENTSKQDKQEINNDTQNEEKFEQENTNNHDRTLEENANNDHNQDIIDKTTSVNENGKSEEFADDIKSAEEKLEDQESAEEGKINERSSEILSETKSVSENEKLGEDIIGDSINGDNKIDDKSNSVSEATQGENQEHVKEEEKEDQGDNKTIGEALLDIKDEVKDNVKYLANQIKNVFIEDNEDKKEEINSNENMDPKLEENNEKLEINKEEDKTDQSNNDEYQKDNNKETIETKENVSVIELNGKESESEVNIKEENVNKQETEKESEETKQENEIETKPTDKQTTANNGNSDGTKENSDNLINETELTSLANSGENSNISNSAAALKSPKNENIKTDEDENNNTGGMTATQADVTSTAHTSEVITDEQYKELEKSLEEYKNGEENVEEEKEKDITDRLEQMADSIKENVKEITDKVMNVLTINNTKDESDNVKEKLNDKTMHEEDLTNQSSAAKVVQVNESNNDTSDEDEELHAESEENSNETEENNEIESEMLDENENQPETELGHDPPIETEKETETEPVTNGDKIDSNEINEEKSENKEDDVGNSPSPSLAIEGFIQGDAEDNTVQSQIAAYVHDDEETRLQRIIASGDMEHLAQIVLNGDGQKLLNVEATEPEIQAFLKNVPNYMDKIRRVHEAARSGSLLNLQQALDRRKFAIAKDDISPNGATPLHVAVVFGNSDIVRYLSARFPETMTMTDNDGRTALHYAAVINDNGHFYNVLLQLGANPKEVDKMGYTPEDYLGKDELHNPLNYVQLLKRFGAEDLEQSLLHDQGHIENQSVQENPLFKTEQGKYLADNLADPLIKALTQVAQKRPNDPLQYVANYLQSYVTSRHTNGRTITQAAVHSAGSQKNSTNFASTKQSAPQPPVAQQQRQTAHMNGHINYESTENIEQESLQQNEPFDADGDADDDNDSDGAMSKKMEERDEHGQSMLHFACARSHRKGGLIHLIEDSKTDITYRDELYRTARDVALQANQFGNAKEIDSYVMSLAIVGDIKPFEHLALSGYDHIIDVLDNNETPVIEVVEARGLHELGTYLRSIRPLEELREELHQMIRDNNVGRVKEIADGPNGKWLIRAKNYYGRTALHIAILKESVEIVEHFVNICPEALKIGDNLERTALHYAMGTNIIESVSRILIQNGAKRTNKDLKGRQPSYYFMNKADILRLQEEEDESR